MSLRDSLMALPVEQLINELNQAIVDRDTALELERAYHDEVRSRMASLPRHLVPEHLPPPAELVSRLETTRIKLTTAQEVLAVRLVADAWETVRQEFGINSPAAA